MIYYYIYSQLFGTTEQFGISKTDFNNKFSTKHLTQMFHPSRQHMPIYIYHVDILFFTFFLSVNVTNRPSCTTCCDLWLSGFHDHELRKWMGLMSYNTMFLWFCWSAKPQSIPRQETIYRESLSVPIMSKFISQHVPL